MRAPRTGPGIIYPCSRTPVLVGGGHHFTALAAGGRACGVRTDGAVLCWQGELPPAVVPGVSGARGVSVGGSHACAVTGAGAIVCWGDNRYSQLGVPGPGSSAAAVLTAPPAAPAVSVSAGTVHTCSVTHDGRAACWGVQDAGRLGTGG